MGKSRLSIAYDNYPLAAMFQKNPRNKPAYTSGTGGKFKYINRKLNDFVLNDWHTSVFFLCE